MAKPGSLNSQLSVSTSSSNNNGELNTGHNNPRNPPPLSASQPHSDSVDEHNHLEHLWSQAIVTIRESVGQMPFSVWIAPLKLLSCQETADATDIELGAPTLFARDWILDNYIALFQSTFEAILHKPTRISVIVNSAIQTNHGESTPNDIDLKLVESRALEQNKEISIFDLYQRREKPVSSRGSKRKQNETLNLFETQLKRGAQAKLEVPYFGENFVERTRSERKSPVGLEQPIETSNKIPNDALKISSDPDKTTHKTLPERSDGTSLIPSPVSSDLGTEQNKFLENPISESEPSGKSEPIVAAISVRQLAASMFRTLGQPLDPRHNFDTFVVGPSNQFAHAAARAVADQPGNQYNPLFLYSDAGLGKTHLLHAIGIETLKKHPKSRICYISAEKFVNDLIEAIHHGKMVQFRERYRESYDMLLMDDIQFIAGKDRTQEEFFHTFNALHSSRRQIVVTSDKFPKDIKGLEGRLRTRFEWGLIADIHAPEIETRIAILRTKAEIDDIFLPNDVALFLATNIKSNIRELEGALIRLGAQASLTGSEITIELAKQLLKGVPLDFNTAAIRPDTVIEAVAAYFQLSSHDLKGRERSRKVSQPRQIAMFLVRKLCELSYPEIGLLFGGKDHSTVLHGVKAIADSRASDLSLQRHLEQIQSSILQ